jgi:hypothetical protein
MFLRRFALISLLLLAPLAGASLAQAQLVLPGAVAPGTPPAAGKRPAGTIAPLAPGKPPRKRSSGEGGGSAVGKPPGEEAVAERPLFQNGAAGGMELARRDKALHFKALTFAGEQLAKPGESCAVSLALTPPIVAKPAGQPAGLLRYEAEIEACPFSFDILDEAVLVSSPNPTCEFKAAGCAVNPTGLWGPKAAAFTPAKAKEIERARTRWEAAARASFRAAAAAADKNAVKLIAREQAGFSSEREEQCRTYAGESSFGFCAARITQARAFALRAKMAAAQAAGAEEKKGKR